MTGTPDPQEHPQTPSPAPAIRAAIEDRGSISFAEFMELALYGPGGFYERPPVGERGHFVTSPHVHPVFGELLVSALLEMRDRLSGNERFTIVELGAGDGTLSRQLLRGLGDDPALRYVAVERSPGARAQLHEVPVQVVSALEEAGSELVGCVLANEVLDNVPFYRVRRRTDGELVDVRVGLKGADFVEVEGPCPPDLAAAAPRLLPSQEAPVSLEGPRLVERAARILKRGYVLAIDYGDATGNSPGPVHGYRRHRVIADVLADPGAADITAGVDFDAVIRRARRSGLVACDPISQRDVLMALGYRRWDAAERDRQVGLLNSGGGSDAVATWSARSRASLLVDPASLGGLQWLLVATPGAPIPSWIRAGSRDP
jgi:SAM-dependent MidA family methyltransferase